MSDLPVETFRLTQGLSPSRLSDGMEEDFQGQEEVRNREEAAIGKDGLSAIEWRQVAFFRFFYSLFFSLYKRS